MQALREIMVDNKFGHAGSSVVIEEYLEADEISILTFTDGKTFKSLPPGQDHKRIFDGNKGPNTSGMGVYAPVSFVTGEQLCMIEQTIIQPTLDGLANEGERPHFQIVTNTVILKMCQGRPFRGMLFTGIMMTKTGPKILEYNERFGDPETQSMMMLLAPECDLAALLLACCNESLDTVSLPILPGFACNVVVAAGGYPGENSRGDAIKITPSSQGPQKIYCSHCFGPNSGLENVQLFHAGTERGDDGQVKTAGGRVFSVAAYGSSLEEAVSLAYEGVGRI